MTKKVVAKKTVTKKKVQINRSRRRPYEPPEANGTTATSILTKEMETKLSDVTEASVEKPVTAVASSPFAPPPERQECDRVIKGYVILAMGIGTIPAPLIDAIAIAVLQTRMVRRIARLYSEPYDAIHTWTLTSITGVFSLPGGLAASMTKAIPIVGPWLGGASVPLIAGASIYAIGSVFSQHFRSGGTFLTLDPVQAKRRYRAALSEGHNMATRSAPRA